MSLWTETHAPEGLDDVVSPDVRDRLEHVAEDHLNALLHGPPGSGKSAYAEVLAVEEFDSDGQMVVLNARDFFGMTKDEIVEDPRFEGFISSGRARSTSKADLMTHVLTEIASHGTVGGGQKLLLIDDADGMRRDFQQSLRRVMETHAENTQFVLTARSVTSLIPPLVSRCVTVPVRAPDTGAVEDRLRTILSAEDVPYDDDGVCAVVAATGQNLRRAVLAAQRVAVTEDTVTEQAVTDALRDEGQTRVHEMIASAREGSFTDAVEALDELLIDRGYSGREVLDAVVDLAEEADGDAAEIVAAVGDAEATMQDGVNDRIHVEQLLTTLE